MTPIFAASTAVHCCCYVLIFIYFGEARRCLWPRIKLRLPRQVTSRWHDQSEVLSDKAENSWIGCREGRRTVRETSCSTIGWRSAPRELRSVHWSTNVDLQCSKYRRD